MMSSLSIASSSPSSSHLSRSASTSSQVPTPTPKHKTEKVHAQDLEEIERQWARFRRQNAKATEKIAAEEFHQQRIKQEEERVRKAYEDLMACSDADASARRKRQQKNLKTAAALMMGGKSFANNQNTNNTKQSPPPSPPPQAILLTVPSDSSNKNNDQQQPQTRSRGPSFNKTIDNNSLSVSDMTYNNNNNSLSARPRSLSSVSNNNNNSFGSQQRRRSSTTTSIGQGGGRGREPSLPKIDLNDPATRKAVRLIERKIRLFLQNKAKAERQVELERAAADSFSDASLRGWRNEVWVGATLMRPRYQLSSSVVANIEMQRRNAEGKLRAGIERLKAAEEYQEKTSAYLSGNNKQWVHDHLVRSADRFAKRHNRPVLTSMDVAEQHLMMSPFSRQQQQQKWR